MCLMDKFLVLLILCVPFDDAVTMDEAQQNPKKYIKYDTTSQQVWLQVILALVTNYVILALIWMAINLVFKMHGHKHRIRAY